MEKHSFPRFFSIHRSARQENTLHTMRFTLVLVAALALAASAVAGA
jgi:hypothetical protein